MSATNGNGHAAIRPMTDRRFEKISVEEIKIVNSRGRDETQFQMNVSSIDQTGLQKPILVNDKFRERTGNYELICGEGRLIAYQRLGRQEIEAEIVSCTRKEAHLQSLIENIARSRPGTMDFANELKRLHDEGWTYENIARIACRSPEYIRSYIGLVEMGEDRLIRGVERGAFPISFAVVVAQSDTSQVQHILMDAFDQGLVNCTNLALARRIISSRASGKAGAANGEKPAGAYSVQTLKKDIASKTKTKESFVREAKTKENRFLGLLTAINALWGDKELLELLEKEGLADRPTLEGNYHYQP